jgi:Fe2+ or Zn2+ uptake regulation protein
MKPSIARDQPMVDEWLAQMPVDVVRRRIAEIESELRVLRGVARSRRVALRRLSPQRAAILAILREHPDGTSPQLVTREMNKRGLDVDMNAVQTNMSRMVTRGQIRRVGHGIYVCGRELPATALLCCTVCHGDGEIRVAGLSVSSFSGVPVVDPQEERSERCPACSGTGVEVVEWCQRCKGEGTIVKDGPHNDEYDNQFPCPDCTMDRTALRGTGRARTASADG